MQKFTVFSILLSISVVLIIGDIIFYDYLNLASPDSSSEEVLPVPIEAQETQETIEPEAIEPEAIEEDPSVDLFEDPAVLQSTLEPEIFIQAGFLKSVLKETSFSGLIFQFIPFSDQSEAFIYQWNLFDGEKYIGSIYEIKYPTETDSFQGYLAARERAMGLKDLGETNEVNNYGDASFYFNHKTKTKTVHLLMRSGKNLYGFEYGQAYHETMKKVFDTLSSPL